MDNQVYTYALMKSLYDMGKDYIDCFSPFVLKVLSDGTIKHTGDIQSLVVETTGIAIPQYTLKTILKRCSKNNYVDSLGHGQYKIAENGSNFLDSLDTQDIVQRKLNALSNDLSSFLTSRMDKIVDHSEAFSLLRRFIEANLLLTLEQLNPEIEGPPKTSEGLNKNIEKHLINYIEHLRLNSPEHYNTIREITLGCTLSLALFCPDFSSIKEKFKHTTVYLDSNFILSILGFHHEEFAAPARELFDMVKNYGFTIKVFHTTVDEICRVVNRFALYEHSYTSNVRVDSIYSKLKSKGWTRADSRNFVLSIEDKLAKLQIQIEVLEDVDINTYKPSKEDLIQILEQYKPGQWREGQNHDLIAVEQIIKRRHHSVRNIQHAKVFFLTSDLKLAKFNFEYFGHKSSCTVSEVISDFLLANILWLQNPESSLEMPLKLLIAAHSKYLFVQRKIWERFIDVLRDLKDDGCVSDDKLAALLYQGRIEELLRNIDETERDTITREFVIEEIEKATIEIDETINRKLEQKEAEVRDIFKQTLSHQQAQQNEEWLNRITKIKSNLRNSSIKKSFWPSFIISSLATIAILIIIALLYKLGLEKFDNKEKLPLLTFFIALGSFIVGGSGIVGIWRDLYKFLKTNFSERSYAKMLKAAGLSIED
jgi:predicted nucleic acid-binding protein